jgi:hypothetical protein
LIGGTLAATALGGATIYYGFKGYQAYLRWLVAELPQGQAETPQPAASDVAVVKAD